MATICVTPLGVLSVGLIATAAIVAAESTPADNPILPEDIVKRMHTGINMGNVLEAPFEGEWAPKAQEYYFDEYRAKGFKSVRIPVRWANHTQVAQPYNVSEKWMARVEQVVQWSMQRGLITVINTHHEKWLDDPTLFEKALPRLEAIWRQIAERFAGFNHTLVFELFNEPHEMTADQLLQMNKALLPIIRKSNPTRIVLFGGLHYMNPEWILQNPNELVFPSKKEDPYIMLEIHNYDPHKYAQPNPTIHYWGNATDKATLKGWIANITDWGRKHEISLLYGEFGCTNTQTKATGRYEWYKDHREYAEAAGLALMAWDDMGNYVLFNRTARTWDEGVLEALGLNTQKN